MHKKKIAVFNMLEMLTEESDNEHVLKASVILGKLRNNYGIEIDRRTMYDNLQMLRESGYDISGYLENGAGYCLNKHLFSINELAVLVKAVRESDLSAEEKADAEEKLLKTASKYQRETVLERL